MNYRDKDVSMGWAIVFAIMVLLFVAYVYGTYGGVLHRPNVEIAPPTEQTPLLPERQ